MGSTGARTNTSGISTRRVTPGDFGVGNGRIFEGNLPFSSGLDRHGTKDIQIAVGEGTKKNIIFQFKLVDDNKRLSIKAYDPNTGKKANVTVSAKTPSISSVEARGTAAQKSMATKLKNMMNQSSSGVSESSLVSIVSELKRRK